MSLVTVRSLTLTCDDLLVFLLAEMDIRTGWTMVWTKCRIAVRRRHRFLQICWNLFSLSIPEIFHSFMVRK